MKTLLQKLAPVGAALGFFALELVASPAAHAAVSVKQEFSGTFTLLNSSPLLEGTLPRSSAYSGFVVYEENGTLSDWEFNAAELNLSLNPSSVTTPGLFAESPPAVSFDLSSLSAWKLLVDFGIAADKPKYTLERNGSEITLEASLGLAGGYVYQDPAAVMRLASSYTPYTPVPEPGIILGLLAVGSAGLAAKLFTA